MKRRRRRVAAKTPVATAPGVALPTAPVADDDAALLALLAHALEAQARRREDDLPTELAASDLLRTCLTAASLVDGPARELITRTAREAFRDATQKPARAPRRRAA